MTLLERTDDYGAPNKDKSFFLPVLTLGRAVIARRENGCPPMKTLSRPRRKGFPNRAETLLGGFEPGWHWAIIQWGSRVSRLGTFSVLHWEHLQVRKKVCGDDL